MTDERSSATPYGERTSFAVGGAPADNDPTFTGRFEPVDPGASAVSAGVGGRAARRLGRVWQRLGLLLGRQLATVVRDDHAFLIVMAAVVGVASGAAAGALLAWIEAAIELFPRPNEVPTWLRWSALVLVPVAGGLLATLAVIEGMTHVFKSDAQGQNAAYMDPSVPLADGFVDAILTAVAR